MTAERIAEILRERAAQVRRGAERSHEYAIAQAFDDLAGDFEDEAVRERRLDE